MSNDAHPQLRLSPAHMQTLAAFAERRVISARLYREGRFEPEGLALYGRLEVLANCGLVEFLARDGERDVSPGDVSLYYYLTDRGRDLLRWRVGRIEPGLNPRPTAPRYDATLTAELPPRP
jgi:hypothetical protein